MIYALIGLAARARPRSRPWLNPTLLATALLLPFGTALLVPFLGRGGLRRSRGDGRDARRALARRRRCSAPSTAARDLAQFAIDVPFIPSLGVGLKFALDGYNAYLVLLTALLFPVVLACAWDTGEGRSPLYLALLLLLEAALLGTFLAQDLLVFFVLWEAVLIPMVLLILVFGGPQRRRAAISFFLYTMAGSVLLLAAVIFLGAESARQTGQWAFDYATLEGLTLTRPQQGLVFLAIALACMVKSPLFPFHAWLPLAYSRGVAEPGRR